MRYPKEFEVISASDIKRDLDYEKKQLIAEYDNAVLYNDYIVNEIISFYENKNSIVIYLSDHGHDVYDSDSNYAGPVFAGRENRLGFEIPFIIWMSKSFKEQYPDKSKAIYESIDRPYMTDDIIHTIIDLADIKGVGEYEPSRSIINECFNSKRKRIVNYGIDYDKDLATTGIK